jgi:NAD(P) transhydrogenase subunit alpha
MIFGIPLELKKHESRVSIAPDTVKKLVKSGHQVLIESDAGIKSSFTNQSYIESGASIVDTKDKIYSSDIILKVNALDHEELQLIDSDKTIISFFQIKDEIDLIQKYVDKKLTLISMSHIPRTTLAQSMDALSSQSNIAGYKASIAGADHITKYMPLLMTSAGTIQPAKVLILGAGVAGLSAIATSKRLGAQVFAFDVRPVVKEQVESLGAKFIEVETDEDEGTGEGGYAKEVSEDYKIKQAKLIKDTIKNMDLVITTALIPEKPAPILIDTTMVESMKPGSAIIDLAAINGGNCELTKSDEVLIHNNITIDGRSNFPSTMPQHSSQLYARNVYNLITHIYNEEGSLNMEDEITQGSTLVNSGNINNPMLQKIIDKEV